MVKIIKIHQYILIKIIKIHDQINKNHNNSLIYNLKILLQPNVYVANGNII